MATHKITLYKSGWTGGMAAFYYNTNTAAFYSDSDLATEITGLTSLPGRETYRFNGFYEKKSTTSPGIQYIDDAGNFTEALYLLAPTAAKTLYINGTLVSYRLTVNDNSGSGGDGTLYYRIDGGGYFRDHLCSGDEVTRFTPPIRTGFEFKGYYSSASSTVQYATPDGSFTDSFADVPLSADKTIYAQWTANTYTITFDANGGRCEVESKTVTFGEAVGELPSPLNGEGYFIAWTMGGSPLTADTVWKIDRDAIAIASWDYHFGRKRDFFFLDGDSLACIESADGCEMSVVETSHDGALAIQMKDSDVGAYKIYGRKLNPVVTYRVIGAASISLTLGKAYAMATRSSKKITIDGVSRYVAEESGYMLTAFEYRTGADKIPTLTLFGTANEGYVHNSSGVMTPKLTDAIHMWTVKFDVSPDHASQDVFGAIDGGGELLSCTIRGECTPVVPLELGMPCASDVVRGKLLVSAQTAAYGGEDAPTARAPFLAVQVNESNSDIDFKSYNIRAERSLN